MKSDEDIESVKALSDDILEVIDPDERYDIAVIACLEAATRMIQSATKDNSEERALKKLEGIVSAMLDASRKRGAS